MEIFKNKKIKFNFRNIELEKIKCKKSDLYNLELKMKLILLDNKNNILNGILTIQKLSEHIYFKLIDNLIQTSNYLSIKDIDYINKIKDIIKENNVKINKYKQIEYNYDLLKKVYSKYNISSNNFLHLIELNNLFFKNIFNSDKPIKFLILNDNNSSYQKSLLELRKKNIRDINKDKYYNIFCDNTKKDYDLLKLYGNIKFIDTMEKKKKKQNILSVLDIKYLINRISHLEISYVISGLVTNKNNDLINEYQNIIKLFSELLLVIKILKKNGVYIFNLNNINLDLSLNLLLICKFYFKNIYFFKPYFNNLQTNEKYVICNDFKGINNNYYFENLLNIYTEWLDLVNLNINNINLYLRNEIFNEKILFDLSNFSYVKNLRFNNFICLNEEEYINNEQTNNNFKFIQNLILEINTNFNINNLNNIKKILNYQNLNNYELNNEKYKKHNVLIKWFKEQNIILNHLKI